MIEEREIWREGPPKHGVPSLTNLCMHEKGAPKPSAPSSFPHEFERFKPNPIRFRV